MSGKIENIKWWVSLMALTRNYKETINARVRQDSAFAQALLDEAVSLFLNGDPEVARLVLRELVNATLGFEELALETARPSKSLHRRLSAKGNPTMDILNSILKVLQTKLQVEIEVHTVPCH
jgi:DNA-binding phage protein